MARGGDAGREMSYDSGEMFGRFVAIGGLMLAALGGGIFFVVSLVMALTRKSRGWAVACGVSGVLAVLGVAGGARMAASQMIKLAEAASDPNGEKRRVVSADGRCGVEVPVAWRDKPDLHEDAVLGATDSGERTCVMVLTDLKADFAGDLKEFDQLTVEAMAEALTGAEISMAESRVVDGCPAIYHRIGGTMDRLNVVYHRMSIETADAFHQVMVWTTASREKRMLPLMTAILGSFESEAGPPVVGGVAADQVPQEIRSRVARVIAEVLGVDAESVPMRAKLVEDLGADELDLVELAMAVEEEFGIAVTDEEGGKFWTVADVALFVEGKVGAEN